MRRILTLTNVDPVDSDFPFGRVRDRAPGQANGTPVNEALLGDHTQFFEKLMYESEQLGGDAPNDLPENDYDGWQLYAALIVVINFGILVAAENVKSALWTPMTLNNNWVDEGSGTYHNAEYYKDPWGWVHLRGQIKRDDSNTGEAVVIDTLPVGFRPVKTEGAVTYMVSPLGLAGSASVYIEVSSGGVITPSAIKLTADPSPLILLDQAGDRVSLDGIKFKTV